VLNESRGADGTQRAITGVARPDYSCIAVQQSDDGASVPGCLLVQFTPSRSSPVVSPFPAQYWILELPDDYRYAVVGTPDNSMLWVLARATYISNADWSIAAKRLVQQHGYSAAALRRLVWTARYGDEPVEPATAADSVIDDVQL
jgi:lipocalin